MFGEKGGGWLHMATYVVININQTCSEQELDKPSLIPRLPIFFRLREGKEEAWENLSRE